MLWLAVLCSCVIFINGQYEVPEARVEVFQPRGFRVSIPDEDGIKLFAFHGKINEEFDGREAGTFARDILKPRNGRWTFTDKTTKLKQGDVIYYWTYVDYFDGQNKLGYARDDQSYVVNNFDSNPDLPKIDIRNPDFCRVTDTQSSLEKVCQGQVIFQDDFSTKTLKSVFWTPEQRFAQGPDYEFVMYMNTPETLQVTDGVVRIKPLLSEDVFGHDFVHSKNGFKFGENCTDVAGSPGCSREYDGFLLPPVVSAQITTKQKFAFKYGKIEIRAKLPKGDWIYPELYLTPLSEIYGSNLQSGQIRVAFVAGNLNENHILHGGITLGATPAARAYGDRTTERRSHWSDDFHTFTVNWKPNGISVGVDNMTYGTIFPPSKGFAELGPSLKINTTRWKEGSEMAPFDQMMYITIGLGVGGESFEDRNDGTKPWRSKNRNMVKTFYEAKKEWWSTWSEKSVVEVDYIKVSAL
nr:beta-1,3-glucan-binding protein-like isoform X1 [Leptinotarsa decemlineata]